MEKPQGRLTRHVRRVVIAVIGGFVLLAGIIMIPYPGPGWAVVFIGLAILAQEFTWARRALHYARAKYDRWESWVKQQTWPVRTALFVITCIVVIVTIWLVNGYGVINEWLRLGLHWLDSPFIQ